MAFIQHSFKMTYDAVEFEKRWHHDEVTPKPCTAEKWADHIRSLIVFGILLLVEWNEVKFVATYFAVAKGECCSRAIFNGRGLSSKMDPPPPVNLAMLGDVLEEIGKMKGPCHILCGDLRHWFHQIPLGRDLSSYFGIRHGGASYRRTTLPMGVGAVHCAVLFLVCDGLH